MNDDDGTCCGGPEWRGRLCTYHQGYEDGYEAGRKAHEILYSVIVEPDGTVWRRDDPEAVRTSHTDTEGVSRRPETLRPNPSNVSRSGGLPWGNLVRTIRNRLTRTRQE